VRLDKILITKVKRKRNFSLSIKGLTLSTLPRLHCECSMVTSDLGTMNFLGQRSCFLRLHFPARSLALLSAAIILAGSGHAKTIEIPSGIPLAVELLRHSPMRAGEPLEGRLLYPVFIENRIAIPAGSILQGRVIRLNPDRSRRIQSLLRGDFTPFYTPVVQFDHVVIEDGIPQAIVCDSAKDGMLILRLSPPPGQKKGSFLGRQWREAKRKAIETTALFTAPGRGDRLVQFVYGQLPYHPQRIETGTTWTVELAQPLRLQLGDDPSMGWVDPPLTGTKHPVTGQPPDFSKRPPNQAPEWQLRAYLQRTISSAKDKPGDVFEAYVAEPVFNSDHALVVPEGSLLVGEITQAKPARSFGRQGKLRFHFKELRFPTGFSQPVEGSLAGADSNKAANLQIDPEGGIEPHALNRVVAPLILTLLAGRAFDSGQNRTLNHAVSSNGFGIVGRVIGMAASSRNVAAGIGFYGVALSVYDLWLARGHNVVFAKETRIEITTTPRGSQLKAAGVMQTRVGSP
jgi:hypothetical protein